MGEVAVPLLEGDRGAYLDDVVMGLPSPNTLGKYRAEWTCLPNAPEPKFNIGRPYNARVSHLASRRLLSADTSNIQHIFLEVDAFA